MTGSEDYVAPTEALASSLENWVVITTLHHLYLVSSELYMRERIDKVAIELYDNKA